MIGKSYSMYEQMNSCAAELNSFILQVKQVDSLNNNAQEDGNLKTHYTPIHDEPKPVENADAGGCSNTYTNSYSDEWYTDKAQELSNCPFNKFHHSGLATEFLKYPYYHKLSDKRSQHILAGMDDHSSGIYMKIQFIVNNFKDSQGIWPQLFLQKLNSIIVNADHTTVKAVLSKDNFTILKKLVDYYANETKCEMVFRYWCLIYNAFARNLVPVLPDELKNKLMKQFQTDFSLAAQNICRCKLDAQEGGDSECALDEEHKIIRDQTQMKITAFLMYYVTCKVGDYSNSAGDINKDTPSKLNAVKFIKGTLVHMYIKVYENFTKEPSILVSILMETLSHVLIAYHTIPFEKNVFSAAIEVMLDMGCLSAAVKTKDMLLRLLEREFDAFQKGPGSKLIFIDPEIRISFQTLGISSVLKCLNSLISHVEYPIILRDEQTQLLNMLIAMQTFLGESSVWNGEYEKIYLHCRHLQCTLEKKLGFHMSDIKLDSDTETANESGLEHSDYLIADSSASSQTSHSKLCSCTYVSALALDDNEETIDDWAVDTRNISKLRKGYEHEITANNDDNGQQQPASWLSRWMSRTMEAFVTCGKCCDDVKD